MSFFLIDMQWGSSNKKTFNFFWQQISANNVNNNPSSHLSLFSIHGILDIQMAIDYTHTTYA